MTSWRHAVSVYRDRRVLAVLLLGFSSGLPLALTGATLAVRLTESGVSLADIGLFALVGVPYAVKFLWAPLVDRLPIPGMTRLFGRRRGWMLATQGALIASLLALGAVDPAADPWRTALFALAVAFCSASQDIVIDAYRVEILDEEQYGAGAAMVQFGYRIAMLVSGAGALFLATAVSWPLVYAAMAGLVGIGVLTVLFNPEPPAPPVPTTAPAMGGISHRAATWLRDAVIEPFAEMIRRNGAAVLAILAFVILYKLGDALAGVMANPFYLMMGFSKAEIASVSKLFGFAATILGTFLGGLIVAKAGIMRALLLCGALQMASNLMFAAQAAIGYDVGFLTLTIAVENLSGGMGSAAFVAYISALCNVSYTGTQYALLSSLAVSGRTLLSASGGFVVEAVGWVQFFVFSTVAALPGLLLLLWMMRRFPPRPVALPAAAPLSRG
ncbi:MAG: AmpG family muropeptide MFS transporter [Rhodospirillales bacterium]|nr:AmpG family muropeptide MFS transporter [Rhodospirillales bacterium]